MIWTALIVFAAMFGLDFIWAFYTNAITAKRPVAAGYYASVIVLLSGAATIGYTQDPWMLMPAVAGAFSGTYAAVKFSARSKQSESQ